MPLLCYDVRMNYTDLLSSEDKAAIANEQIAQWIVQLYRVQITIEAALSGGLRTNVDALKAEAAGLTAAIEETASNFSDALSPNQKDSVLGQVVSSLKDEDTRY